MSKANKVFINIYLTNEILLINIVKHIKTNEMTLGDPAP